MRVVCASVEEFLKCLESEKTLLQDAVRISIFRNPMDGKNQRDATKFKIILQASAVVNIDEESQYLLEVGKDCGRDIEDAEPTKEGTELATALKDQIEAFVVKRGWRVLPGTITF